MGSGMYTETPIAVRHLIGIEGFLVELLVGVNFALKPHAASAEERRFQITETANRQNRFPAMIGRKNYCKCSTCDAVQV